MENIDCTSEPDSVHGAVCVAIIVLHNLQNTGAFPNPRFGSRVFAAKLSNTQRGTDSIPHRFRKPHQIAL
jgi:hypothetical protein